MGAVANVLWGAGLYVTSSSVSYMADWNGGAAWKENGKCQYGIIFVHFAVDHSFCTGTLIQYNNDETAKCSSVADCPNKVYCGCITILYGIYRFDYKRYIVFVCFLIIYD